MKSVAFALPVLVVLVLVSAAPRLAQAAEELAVPGYPVAIDVPGAHELPDPTLDYKIAWGIGQGAQDPTTEINPTLPTIALYVNTLAKWGVPNEKRHIIVMFHQRSDDFDIVLSNDAFKAKYGKVRSGGRRQEDRPEGRQPRHPGRPMGYDFVHEPADEGVRSYGQLAGP